MVPAMSHDDSHPRSPADGVSDDQNVDFGFRRVDAMEKPRLVRAVFDSVAERYDLMNDLMSGGIHRLWKAAMIDWLQPRAGMHLLDIGGGTGDIAFRFLDSGGGTVTVSDINLEMLKVGRKRAEAEQRISGLTWLCADAERLPVADASVDAYTIAFCIRNVTHIDRVLSEARRVLKPGGRFLCLEFSRVVLPVMDRLYDSYSFRVLPAIGQVVTGNADAYRYLAESMTDISSSEQTIDFTDSLPRNSGGELLLHPRLHGAGQAGCPIGPADRAVPIRSDEQGTRPGLEQGRFRGAAGTDWVCGLLQAGWIAARRYALIGDDSFGIEAEDPSRVEALSDEWAYPLGNSWLSMSGLQITRKFMEAAFWRLPTWCPHCRSGTVCRLLSSHRAQPG